MFKKENNLKPNLFVIFVDTMTSNIKFKLYLFMFNYLTLLKQNIKKRVNPLRLNLDFLYCVTHNSIFMVQKTKVELHILS